MSKERIANNGYNASTVYTIAISVFPVLTRIFREGNMAVRLQESDLLQVQRTRQNTQKVIDGHRSNKGSKRVIMSS